jgi:hypothetical protein
MQFSSVKCIPIVVKQISRTFSSFKFETLYIPLKQLPLELIGIGKDFLNGTPAAQQLKDRIDKWDFIKLKSFCSTKGMVSKLKRPPTE